MRAGRQKIDNRPRSENPAIDDDLTNWVYLKEAKDITGYTHHQLYRLGRDCRIHTRMAGFKQFYRPDLERLPKDASATVQPALADYGMTMKELSEYVGLSPGYIRELEKLGILPDPPRSKGGWRLYSDAHARRLKRWRDHNEERARLERHTIVFDGLTQKRHMQGYWISFEEFERRFPPSPSGFEGEK